MMDCDFGGVLLVDWEGGETEERNGNKIGRARWREGENIHWNRMSDIALSPDPISDCWN